MKRNIKPVFYLTIFAIAGMMFFYAGRNFPYALHRLGPESAVAFGENSAEFPRLQEAYSIIMQRYLDKLDSDEMKMKLEYGAIKGMLKAIEDPYTRFMDPKAYNNMAIETKGKFGGVGIVIGIRNEQLTVISPLEGTPAFKAGIKSGDIIIKIDGNSTEDMALDDAVARIRGDEGTKVTLTLWRRDFKSEGKEFVIVREEIELKPINESKMIEGTKIGYIKLETFSKVSKDTLKETILDFKKQGMNSLILDLRYNPGGLLDAAIEVANLFVDEGPIVHRQDRNGKLLTYYAKSGNKIVDMPTVVLVNEFSASASEIVSGAMQDHGVATVMGVTTFGKGLVQTVFNMQDDSAILVTTDKYLTAKKRDINKKGIVPDIVVKTETVDTHETTDEEKEGDDDKGGKVGKFPLEDLKGTNGIIFNGMPLKDVKYKVVEGKRYLEVDDMANLFRVSVQLDKDTGILDIEKNEADLEKKNDDIQLQKAIEYLKEKTKG